jgi:recombination protein RecT
MGTTTAAASRPSFLAQLAPEDRARRAEVAKAAHNVVAKAAGPRAVADYFELHRAKVEEVLPANVSAARLLAVALDAIRRNPKLLDCTVSSLFGAVLLCAKMGLEPNTHQGHVYLIPRAKRRAKKDENGQDLMEVGKNGKKWKVFEETWEVHVQLGYKGRIELAYRSPKVQLIKAVIVRERDFIDIDEGTRQVLAHQVDPRKPISKRGPIIGSYAIAKLSTGEALFEWMDIEQIHKIRDENSDAYTSAALILNDDQAKDWSRKKAADTPWISDEEQMIRKTLINRIDNYIPSTPEMALASAIDSADIEGVAQDLDAVVSGTDIRNEQGREDEMESVGTEQAAGDTGVEENNGGGPADAPKGTPTQIEQDKTPPIDIVLDKPVKEMSELQRESQPAETADSYPADAGKAKPGIKPKRGAIVDQASFDAGFGSAE